MNFKLYRNMKNFKLLLASMLIMILAFTSCEDLEVENLNEPDRARALSDPGDLISLMKSGTLDSYWGITTSWGTHFHLMADQITTTNKSRQFWDFAEEPRLRLQNDPNYGGLGALTSPWSNLNSAVVSSNAVLSYINDGNTFVDENDNDITKQMEAGALFAKGFAQGYLGVIFDKAYIVDFDSDLGNLELQPYTALIDEGIANMQAGLAAANAAPNFKYDLMVNVDMDITEFTKYANSMLARIASQEARTSAEAATLDWNQILTWANNGFTEDFYIETSPGNWFNSTIDWAGYVLNSGAGYLPTDLKVAHLADPVNIPQVYPATGVLDQADSPDARFEQYFTYTTDFGYLRPERNRGIFSNWYNSRFMTNNTMSEAGDQNPQFLLAEIQMLKAEANMRLGNNVAAAAAINNSPRTSVGGLDPVLPTDDLTYILHYEYSIELDLAAGSTTQWAFMRRNDLLQEGTPFMFPIPATELEATGLELYSFGGIGQEGGAVGNGWKN
ncbi:hypothetical protein AWW68_18700 [Roseivirga spongicola]|uniref:SusD-like N-terminal domain-containing protein n=2 Tax=Roseivirgaceae TaxID=2762306 RepID=A0A150WXM9_9BACT|nr:hypothetical protein AWW68_18700 [Roseivirga spongicola]